MIWVACGETRKKKEMSVLARPHAWTEGLPLCALRNSVPIDVQTRRDAERRDPRHWEE